MASSSSFSTPPEFASLPVMALREKIVEKIQENRVTLIIGETGCGKSSQVPQFLLDEGIEPILCTQPRRFAVVAVARMVAAARRAEVGGEVGYHIGHSKVASDRSKIVFKTAGVLLDEMRDKGIEALRYKVIILDEVHERSVESDLVLAFVKQYMLKKKDLRLVLMSATADISRYRDYFRDLGKGERVEVLAIPSSSQQTVFQRKVLYLEQVTKLLGIDPESLPEGCNTGTESTSEAGIKQGVHILIHELVLNIHQNEPDIEKSILVFLPTYYSLEQQWSLLKPFSSDFKVHILHRSIDTEQALMAMNVIKSHRKVILATNIAESSVTIPGVSYVIDSCRSLQVIWDATTKKDTAKLVWVSKSQAEQRKGRTGRTCDGQIYRFVSRSFFSKLNEHESPSILRLSLRLQILQICSAKSKAINDPKVLLQKVLDPPDHEVIDDAFNLLVHIHALEKPTTYRGRYEPTFYGRMLASLSLSFDASVTVIKFGDIGLLREGILIGILMDQQPLPIVHPFAQEALYSSYVDSYLGGGGENVILTGRKEVLLMGNLCAYQFWQRVFKDKHRLERLKQLNSDGPKATHVLLPKLEEEWCSFHHLLQSSLHHISETYEDILKIVHRFRPKFLGTSSGIPSYYDPSEFEHTCILQSHPSVSSATFENIDLSITRRICLDLPFVASDHFKAISVAEKMETIFKEIRIRHTEEAVCSNGLLVNDASSDVANGVSLCRFFMRGACSRGSDCSFSHSLQAKRPVCDYFKTQQGCRYGERCFFSHDSSPSAPSLSSPSFCLPEEENADAASFLSLLPISTAGCILILDDTDFHFSTNLSRYCEPGKIVSTTSLPHTTTSNDESLSDLKVVWGLSHPYQTIMSSAGECQIPWRDVRCVLWFAKFSAKEDGLEQQGLLKKFFEYIAIRILGDAMYDTRVVLVMNNAKFSQLQVERLARDCFFFLTESLPFDEYSFGEFSDITKSKKPMMILRPVSYVFDLHPPTDIQFGDYTGTLHRCLHKFQ